MQGLKDAEADKPAVNRETTMEATAKVDSAILVKVKHTRFTV